MDIDASQMFRKAEAFNKEDKKEYVEFAIKQIELASSKGLYGLKFPKKSGTDYLTRILRDKGFKVEEGKGPLAGQIIVNWRQ